MQGAEKTGSERWWEGPWPWLVYLVFLPLPWLWKAPDGATLAWTGLALCVFLPLYFVTHRLDGARRFVACLGIAGIGLSLAALPVGWTTFAIYGAAEMGRLRPARPAAAGIAVIALATTLTGLAWGYPILFWLPGVLLVVMTGGATISRTAFEERTRALLATQEEVRRLAGTAERERIARDLHDVVGRTLTLVALKADLAGRMLVRDPPVARAEIDAIAAAARAGLAEVRAALSGQGGGSLAHEATASIAALRTAGVEAELTGDPARVPADAGAVLAMTLREAVTNVIRHAGARRCTIGIAAEADEARLVVSDDGVGRSAREGNGLTGMRQRLVAAGGSLSLTSMSLTGGQPGTRLEASVPA